MQMKYKEKPENRFNLQTQLRTNTKTRYHILTSEEVEKEIIKDAVKDVPGLFSKLGAKRRLRSILSIMGEVSKENASYIMGLHTREGFSFDLIEAVISKVTSFAEPELKLSCGEILSVKAADIMALFQIIQAGRCNKTAIVDVYDFLPKKAVQRASYWVQNMAGALALPGPPPPPVGADDPPMKGMESILKDSIAQSIDLPKLEYDLAFKLLRICIFLSGGYMFKIDTLKMTAIWTLMLDEMEQISSMPDNFLEYGGIFMALWVSLGVHMVKEDVSSTISSTVQLLSVKSPEVAKKAFYALYEKFGGDSMNAKKYVAWNKTISVLIEKDNIDMPSAMRMMSTFTMGRTFIRILTDQSKFRLFLNDLSPVPGPRTINNLLSLYRSESVYKAKTDKLLNSINGVVKDDVTEESVQKALTAYFELLKLKIAYLPNYDYGKNGEISDPLSARLDDDLIDLISRYAFSRKSVTAHTTKQWEEFKDLLRRRIINNVGNSFFDYFGQPAIPVHKEPYDITYL